MNVKKVSDLTEDDRRKLDAIAFNHLGPKAESRLKAKVARPEFVVMTDFTYCGILFRDGLYSPPGGQVTPVKIGGITRVRGPQPDRCVMAAAWELNDKCDLMLYFREGERFLKALGFARFRGTVKASEAVLGEPLVVGPSEGVLDLRGLPW